MWSGGFYSYTSSPGTLGTFLHVFVLNKTRHQGISLIKARLSKDLGKESVCRLLVTHISSSSHRVINPSQLHSGYHVHPRGNSKIGHKEAVKGSINMGGPKTSLSEATCSLPPFRQISYVSHLLSSPLPVSLCFSPKVENSQVQCPLLR